MSILIDLLKGIAGMFLADGRLPIWLIAWVLVIGAFAFAGAGDLWRGALLLGGMLAILAANVLGAARAARKAAPTRPK
jgi:hypothetical protein